MTAKKCRRCQGRFGKGPNCRECGVAKGRKVRRVGGVRKARRG